MALRRARSPELERPAEAIEVYSRGLEVANREDPRRVGALAGNLAVSLASVGRYVEAAARAREAVAAAQRTAERFVERWARLVLGRALCSLGEWDDALSEIESVKDEVPPFQVGMAIAPLVVIALARGEDERVRELVAEHDRRCSDAGASVFESDFRSLRAMVLDPESDRDGRTPPAEIITGAQVADYAEWAGWLGPVVDRVLADPGREQLVVALEALRGPGAMKRFPPVLAQAERLDAHLAMRAGEPVRAAECWMRAESLAGACGLVFETAVIALERGEHGADPEGAALTRARATFERLGAAPWLTRALQAGAGSAPAG